MTDFEQGREAYDKGDYLTAFRILHPLSVRGELESMLVMAFMFEMGQGVPQNYIRACELYYSASRHNDVRAEFKMGVMHYHGFGTPIEYITARTFFTTAAEKGHAGAQYYLGLLYENGQKVDKIPTEAHKWFNLAASNGYEKGAEARDRIAGKMKPEEIAKAQREAFEWFIAYFNRNHR